MLLSAGCRKETDAKPKVVIALAANMQFSMNALADAFTEDTQIKCELIMGSSGKLTSQIMEGAPYDIFISADVKYPDELYHNNKAEGKPEVYAKGKLVLWTMVDSLEPSISVLTSDSIQHIALANPKTAPYGRAALEAMKNKGIFKQIEHKLIFGESIAQTNQFINSKSAEIGFTSKSVVLSPQMQNKGRWTSIEDDSYSPLLQSVVLLKKEEGISEETQLFYDFLFSKKAQNVLKQYGYIIPN